MSACLFCVALDGDVVVVVVVVGVIVVDVRAGDRADVGLEARVARGRLLDGGADIHFGNCAFSDNILYASLSYPDLVSHLIDDKGIDPIRVAEKEDIVKAALSGDIKAIAKIQLDAEKGNKYQQLIILEMYERGLGVEKNQAEVEKWKHVVAEWKPVSSGP